MGKRSTRENKNIYQQYRERLELTRDKASELMPGLSADRIEKIESGRSLPHPDEILIMAKGYKAPELCNRYCSGECPIGQRYIPEIPVKDLSQITLDVLSSLNRMSQERDRLIDITVDGKITEDELPDYVEIQRQLDKISRAVGSLQLWVEQTIAAGELDPELLERVRREAEAADDADSEE